MNLNEGVLAQTFKRNEKYSRNGYNIQVIQAGKEATRKNVKKQRNVFSDVTSSSENWQNVTKFGTTGSLNTTTALDQTISNSRVVIAVTEGRGHATCEIGVAAMNITEPELILCQISDTYSYLNIITKINLLNPCEIIIPATLAKSRLTERIKEHFPSSKIIAVPRNTFNKVNGVQYVEDLCAYKWNAIFLVLQFKYYTLAAAGGLLTYIENCLSIYLTKRSIKVEYQESDGSTIIDAFSANKLELVLCATPEMNTKYTSLFGVLNFCYTKIGIRTLRASILQPSCSSLEIQERLDCVEMLVNNPEILAKVEELLKPLSAIDQLLSLGTVIPKDKTGFSTRQLNYLILLNSVFDYLEMIHELIKDFDNGACTELCNAIQSEQFLQLKILVRNIIRKDSKPATGEKGITERCFAIKNGIHSVLDMLRKTYSERVDDLREYVSTLGRQYGLDFKLGNTSRKGYHISLSLTPNERRHFKDNSLPEEFIQVDLTDSMATMKTMKVLTYSIKIEDVALEILKASNRIVYDLLLEVRERIGTLYKVCECIAKLDMLQSFAQVSASSNQYVRPIFGEITEVINSRHPLLNVLCEIPPTPNSFYASPEYNLNIITGPNGAGKSIMLRQIVLLQIMAQIGCFVPAESAYFKIADRIFARIYLDDNMDVGASAFVLEIKEIQYFLNAMTKSSLVVIDEICRSTSVEDGSAIAMAICEYFLTTPAFVYVTTHYMCLADLQQMYLSVKCWQMEAMEREHEGRAYLQHTFKMKPGVTNIRGYAIKLARIMWPVETMAYVMEFMEKIRSTQKHYNFQKLDPRLRLKYDLESELQLLKYKDQLTTEIIKTMLEKYVTDLQQLGTNIAVKDIKSLSRNTTTTKWSDDYSSKLYQSIGDLSIMDFTQCRDITIANETMSNITIANETSDDNRMINSKYLYPIVSLNEQSFLNEISVCNNSKRVTFLDKSESSSNLRFVEHNSTSADDETDSRSNPFAKRRNIFNFDVSENEFRGSSH